MGVFGVYGVLGVLGVFGVTGCGLLLLLLPPALLISTVFLSHCCLSETGTAASRSVVTGTILNPPVKEKNELDLIETSIFRTYKFMYIKINHGSIKLSPKTKKIIKELTW